ncbi:hypothetical protein ACOSP7_007828 [Xanthoceras sorbifolium]
MFIWRFFYGWLPFFDFLVQWKLINATACPFCLRLGESIVHATWRCPTLKLVRKAYAVSSTALQSFLASPDIFLLMFFSVLKREELKVLCIVLWRTWYCRNKFVHDNMMLDAKNIVPWSRFLLEEMTAASRPVPSPKSGGSAAHSLAFWVRPPIGSFKLNTDASVCALGLIGLGAVIRDAQGQAVLSGSSVLQSVVPIPFAEALAIQFGLSLAADNGIGPLLVESDCLGIINHINQGSSLFSEVGLIVDGIHVVLKNRSGTRGITTCKDRTHVTRRTSGTPG